MDRLPALEALLVWGATFYLVTHGLLPPATSESEARELAVALAQACLAWLGYGWRRLMKLRPV